MNNLPIKMQLKHFLTALISPIFIFIPSLVLAQDFVANPNETIETNINIPNIQVPALINEFIQDIQAIVGQIETFLDEQGIEVSQGQIGLPDIEEAKIIFAENPELDKFSDLFGTQTGSTFVNQDKLLQQYLKDLAQKYAENSSLSKQGQKKIAQKVENTNKIIQSSLKLAENSSKQDVSQNILRNISNQLSLQQQIDGLNILEAQEAKVANSLQIEMTSELLSEVSKSNTLSQRQYTSTNKTITNGLPFIIIPTERKVR